MKKLAFSLLSLSMVLAMTACSSPADNLQLEVTEITVEYGDALSLEPKEYLAEDTSEDILSDTKVEVFAVEDDKKDEDPIETDGTDLEVGNYVLSLSYNDEIEDVNVTVKDTTPPEFVDFNDTISIEQGTADVTLENLFKAEDGSDFEITVEGDVDYNTVGTYTVKVVAKDEYDNSTEKDCNIVITEKEVAANTPNTSGGSSGGSSSSNSSSGSSNSSTSSGSNNSSNTGGSSNAGSSSGSSNTGSSSGGSTTTPPSQPEPTPEPHEHKFIVNSTTTYYEGNELLFDNWDDALAKGDEVQYYAFTHSVEEAMEKYGNWSNLTVKGVRCANGCGELWYAVELTY